MSDALAAIIFILLLYLCIKFINRLGSEPTPKNENPPQHENPPQKNITPLPCDNCPWYPCPNCPWSKSSEWRKRQLHNVKIVQQDNKSGWDDDTPF